MRSTLGLTAVSFLSLASLAAAAPPVRPEAFRARDLISVEIDWEEGFAACSFSVHSQSNQKPTLATRQQALLAKEGIWEVRRCGRAVPVESQNGGPILDEGCNSPNAGGPDYLPGTDEIYHAYAVIPRGTPLTISQEASLLDAQGQADRSGKTRFYVNHVDAGVRLVANCAPGKSGKPLTLAQFKSLLAKADDGDLRIDARTIRRLGESQLAAGSAEWNRGREGVKPTTAEVINSESTTTTPTGAAVASGTTEPRPKKQED